MLLYGRKSLKCLSGKIIWFNVFKTHGNYVGNKLAGQKKKGMEMRNIQEGRCPHPSKKFIVTGLGGERSSERSSQFLGIFPNRLSITCWYGEWDKEVGCGWILGSGLRNWVHHGNICQLGETEKGTGLIVTNWLTVFIPSWRGIFILVFFL